MVIIVICLLMRVEQFKSKAKDSSIVANPLILGNISKDWGATNMKKTGLFGYGYDHGVVNFLDIVSIQKYLMMKNNINKIFIFIKKIFLMDLMVLSSIVTTITLSCISIIIVSFSILFYNQHWRLFCLL